MSYYSIKPTEQKHFIDMPGVTTILKPVSFGPDAAAGWATKCMSQKLEEYILDFDGVPTFDEIKDMIKTARFNYKEVSKEARDIGSDVHAIIEKYINSKRKPNLKSLSKEIKNAFDAFLLWEKYNSVEWLESEQTIFLNDPEDSLIYAGTLDAIAIINGRIDIIDFKSSKAFYPDSMIPQLSAYKYSRIMRNGTKAEIKKKDENSYIETYKKYDIKGMGIIRLDKENGYPEYKDYSDKYDRGLESFNHLCRYFYSAKKRRLKNNPLVK